MIEEGLQRRTPAMCQIPTYITRVAHGTEKVNIWNLGSEIAANCIRVFLWL